MDSACRLASAAAAVTAIPSTSSSSSLSSRNSLFFNSSSRSLPLISNNSSRITIRNRRRNEFTCMFGLGVPELAVIAGIATLLFGPKKLPEVGKSLAKTVKSFQQISLGELYAKKIKETARKHTMNLHGKPQRRSRKRNTTMVVGRLDSLQAAKEFETEIRKDPDDSSKTLATEEEKVVSMEDDMKLEQ